VCSFVYNPVSSLFLFLLWLSCFVFLFDYDATKGVTLAILVFNIFLFILKQYIVAWFSYANILVLLWTKILKTKYWRLVKKIKELFFPVFPQM